MIPILSSPQALSDLEAIREYIARDSALYADLVVQDRCWRGPSRVLFRVGAGCARAR